MKIFSRKRHRHAAQDAGPGQGRDGEAGGAGGDAQRRGRAGDGHGRLAPQPVEQVGHAGVAAPVSDGCGQGRLAARGRRHRVGFGFRQRRDPDQQPADRVVLRTGQDLPEGCRVAGETDRQGQVDVVEGAGAAQQGGGAEPGDGRPEPGGRRVAVVAQPPRQRVLERVRRARPLRPGIVEAVQADQRPAGAGQAGIAAQRGLDGADALVEGIARNGGFRRAVEGGPAVVRGGEPAGAPGRGALRVWLFLNFCTVASVNLRGTATVIGSALFLYVFITAA